MEYRDNVQLDASQVGGMGGSGGGGGRGGIAVGGGIGGLIIAVLALLFGINPGNIMGGGSSNNGGGQPEGNPTYCQSAGDIKAHRDCRFVAYTNSIQAYWGKTLQGYTVTKTQPFTGTISTGCGEATAEVGPFYCPADKVVYLDYGFFDELQSRFGAQGGDAAEAYVIAHEYGHHISDLIGTMDQAQQDRSTGPTSSQVRLELQADCFAGVWLKNATKDPNSPIASITQDDVNRAADAAVAVGDDRIQQRATGRVDRESWTHGSSAMRKKWLATGFNSGDPNKCNTFDPNVNLG